MTREDRGDEATEERGGCGEGYRGYKLHLSRWGRAGCAVGLEVRAAVKEVSRRAEAAVSWLRRGDATRQQGGRGWVASAKGGRLGMELELLNLQPS